MGRLFRCLGILSALLCGHNVWAADAQPEQRVLSETERKTFFDFYQKTFPNDHGDQPVFSVRSADSGKEIVLALVDSPPKRGLRSLCRMQRRSFAYTGTWSVSQAPRQLVWLDAKGCSKSARAVRLVHPMPDADVVGLLEHEHDVLKRARLLFGGNSQCASRRALNFSLDSIDIGTAGASPEVLAGLVFKSDRGRNATVWVRRSGLDYNAWTVSCLE